MARNVLVVLGHPRAESLCRGLAEAYARGAASSGSDVRVERLAELAFDPVTPPYRTAGALEPDLQRLQDSILWANHLAFVYPNWWGSAPGLFKAALERVLLPGVAFRYHAQGLGWDRLLKGRSGELIVTMDTPPFVYRWIYGAAGDRILAKRTLEFCGIKPFGATHFGPVKTSSEERRAGWLAKGEALGRDAGR